MRFIKKHLFWKFFFSYFAVVMLSMLVLGVVIRVLSPSVFTAQIGRMANLFTRFGLESGGGQMMRGRGGSMMGGSTLYIDLFSIFNQIIFESVLYALIPSFVVALAVSAFMSRRFVNPLQQMTLAADRIAEGDYQERLPIEETKPESQDELARLAVRFNRMAIRLEQIEDIRQKLIGDVAHELRTPLTVIKGAMEGLIDGVLTPDNASFEMIYRQADRLDRLVNDLQELNHIETGILELHPKPVNIIPLLESVHRTMEINFAKKGVELSLDLSNRDLSIIADEDRFEQIMINLLGNALRYTPGGGEVSVTVQEQPDAVQVSVRDTGIGIPEEHLPFVFSRFYRVDDSRSRQAGGSGIGLTIAKKLVEAQGGKIWAESDGEGQGSVFHFTLPKT